MRRFQAVVGMASAFLSLIFLLGDAHAKELIYSNEPLLSGELCVPDGPGPFPAVVYNHGGQGHRKSGGQSIGGAPLETCAALAAAGFVGFSPIRRPEAEMRVHVEDVLNAVKAIKKFGHVNPDKVALIGFSTGALVSLLSAIRQPDFQALVIMAGGAQHLEKRGANKLARLNAPVLVLVSENDTGSEKTQGVNIVEGMRYLDASLKKFGKDSTLIVYPPFGTDGHSRFWEMGAYWKDVIPFLKHHIHSSSSPNIPAQQSGPSPQKALDRMDSNRDGRIAKSEWGGLPPAFARIDINANGFLEFEELKRWFD